METVPRLYARVRPQAGYRQSLDVLAFAKRYSTSIVKSGFMVGLGETESEGTRWDHARGQRLRDTCQRESCRTGQCREGETLREHLAHEPASRRAKR